MTDCHSARTPTTRAGVLLLDLRSAVRRAVGGELLSGSWDRVPRAWGGCGRPTERDARDHTLSRRRRKRPLADLAAHASGLPVHSCCSARVTCTAGRSRVPSEQVVRRPAAAVERPRCSTSHDHGTGHLEGPLDGYERRADEGPHSRSSERSRRSACDARGTEFLAISMVTTGTLGERSSASWYSTTRHRIAIAAGGARELGRPSAGRPRATRAQCGRFGPTDPLRL